MGPEVMPLGDFVLIRGKDRVGTLIRIAEYLRGDGWSPYSHAAVVVSDELDPQIVEAEPGGARVARLSEYDGWGYTTSHWPLVETQRVAIADAARALIGTPYSFVDYGSLALSRFHIRPGWVVRRLASSKHLICSQLVDECYRTAGLPMFGDHRFPGDVTPANLGAVLDGPQD